MCSNTNGIYLYMTNITHNFDRLNVTYFSKLLINLRVNILITMLCKILLWSIGVCKNIPNIFLYT